MADTSTASTTNVSPMTAAQLQGTRPVAGAPGRPATAAVTEVNEAKKSKKSKKSKKVDGDGKKKKPIKPILIVVVLLLVGYVAKGKIIKPHYGPGHPVPAGVIFDFPAAVTTNLPDGSLAQISISLQLTKAASIKTVSNDTSELVGTAVQIIGHDSYSTLLSTAGRLALQRDLLHAFQSELPVSEGAQQVSAVYFTSYVVQQQ